MANAGKSERPSLQEKMDADLDEALGAVYKSKSNVLNDKVEAKLEELREKRDGIVDKWEHIKEQQLKEEEERYSKAVHERDEYNYRKGIDMYASSHKQDGVDVLVSHLRANRAEIEKTCEAGAEADLDKVNKEIQDVEAYRVSELKKIGKEVKNMASLTKDPGPPQQVNGLTASSNDAKDVKNAGNAVEAGSKIENDTSRGMGPGRS